MDHFALLHDDYRQLVAEIAAPWRRLRSVARQIPLRRRDGSIRAYALVDDEDYEALAQHRWHLTARGYAKRTTEGRDFYLHRQVMGFPPVGVDHEDGNPLNNQRSNLRPATQAQNTQNQGSRGGTSRFRGVSWDKDRRRWRAYGMKDGRQHYLGLYDDEVEAAAVASEYRAAQMPFSEDARVAA